MLCRLVIWMFKRVVNCLGGLYDVQGGYMLFRGLYAFQGGYTLFRWAICCSGELYDVQEGYMLKKIMMILVATNVVGSQPTGTLVVKNLHVNLIYILFIHHTLFNLRVFVRGWMVSFGACLDILLMFLCSSSPGPIFNIYYDVSIAVLPLPSSQDI